MSGPVFSTDLYDPAGSQLRKALNTWLGTPFTTVVESVIQIAEECLRDAYVTGLRDGFAQGVAADRNQEAEGES